MADFNIPVNTFLLVTQTAHGFTVGQAVRRDSGAYALALADSAANARASGIVAEVVGAGSFRLALPGHRVNGLSGLTDGATYYVSDSVAGAITDTAPAIAAPVLVATSATTGIVVECAANAGFVRDGDVLNVGLTFPDGGLNLTEEGGGTNRVRVRIDEVLSDDRVLNITLDDADRIMSLIGDAEISGTNTGDQDLSPYQTIAALAADVRAVVLSGLSLASSAAVAATDTVLEAFGKLQAFNNLFTTVGLALARLANPSAVTFLRINADNTVTARTAAEMRADLGIDDSVTVLGSTQTTTSTSLVDCTGLSVAVEAGATYQIEGFILFQSTATTNGISISLNGPSSPTEFAAQVTTSRLATGNSVNNMNAYDQSQNSADVIAANTSQHANIHGALVNGATAGDLIVRFASESGAQTVRIMAGSSLRLRKVA